MGVRRYFVNIVLQNEALQHADYQYWFDFGAFLLVCGVCAHNNQNKPLEETAKRIVLTNCENTI